MIEQLHKRMGELKSARSTLDSHCQEIAERIWPDQACFTSTKTEGQKKTEKVFDATPALALQRFSAVVDSMVSPQGQTWQRLRASNKDLGKIHAVQVYFDSVTDTLFRYRYSTRANFAGNANAVYKTVGAFGSANMIVNPRDTGGITYETLPFQKTYIAKNSEGVVDTVFREFSWTAKQAKDRWGDNLPDRILNCQKLDEKFTFVHVVMPRPDYDPERIDFLGMPFASYYYCADDKERMLEEGGYTSWPIPTITYDCSPGDTYGRSPAMMALPDIKMLNEMNKTVMRGAHQRLAPPLLLADDMAFSMKPNSLNFGGMNAEGRPLVQRLEMSGDVGLGVDMMQQKRDIINSIFLVSVFQMLDSQGSDRKTATEIIERARMSGAILAPTVSEFNRFLGANLTREIDILARQGLLPEMPGELIEAQGEYEIQYDSPLSRAQRSEEASGFSRTLQQITPLAQIDPSILKVIKTDEVMRGLADLNGMPASWLKGPDELMQEMMAEQQQAQAQQLLEAAPVMAQTQLDMAKAQQVAQYGGAGRV